MFRAYLERVAGGARRPLLYLGACFTVLACGCHYHRHCYDPYYEVAEGAAFVGGALVGALAYLSHCW